MFLFPGTPFMPSNHGVISTDTDIHKEPFTIPDVKTMDKPT